MHGTTNIKLGYYCSSESKKNQEMSLRVVGQELKVASAEYKCKLFTISFVVTKNIQIKVPWWIPHSL